MWWPAFAMPELQRHTARRLSGELWASATQTKSKVNGPQGTAPEAVLWLPHTHIQVHSLASACAHTQIQRKRTFIFISPAFILYHIL